MDRHLEHPYRNLPAEGPYEARLGHALITLVDPWPGEERAFNRWYEDDHFIAGAMATPWMFAGRRWVATSDLQDLRYPRSSRITQPITKGCYLSTYWITAGRMLDNIDWMMATNRRLRADGRLANGLHPVEQIYSSFHDHAASIYRDDTGPRDIHALSYPYAGLALEIIETSSMADRLQLEQWLVAEGLVQTMKGTPVTICMLFRPRDFPDNSLAFLRKLCPSLGGRRLTVLWLLDVDPRSCWSEIAPAHAAQLERSGYGRIELLAPFIPTLPGTDTYVDQLRKTV